MSSRCMAAVFERYPAGGGEFALALALADNAHDDGTHIFPTIDTMAYKSRQDVRSVQRHLKNMREIGWLEQTKRAGGRGRPAEYRINSVWLKGGNLSPISLVDKSAEKGDTEDPKRVTNEAEKGDIQNTPIRTIGTNTPPTPPRGVACGFESIVAEYPRKSHLSKAAAEWRKLAPDAALRAEMVNAIRAWARHPEWQREDGRFVPKLCNWLRDKRWQDVPGYSAPAPSPGPMLAPEPPLTSQQLQANAAHARAAAALARSVLGKGARP